MWNGIILHVSYIFFLKGHKSRFLFVQIKAFFIVYIYVYDKAIFFATFEPLSIHPYLYIIVFNRILFSDIFFIIMMIMYFKLATFAHFHIRYIECTCLYFYIHIHVHTYIYKNRNKIIITIIQYVFSFNVESSYWPHYEWMDKRVNEWMNELNAAESKSRVLNEK